MKKNLLLIISLMYSILVFSESGTCGENLKWTINDSTLVISGSGSMTNYDYYNSAPWYKSYRSIISRVIIKEGITTIGSYAFHDCNNIASFTIPESVTNVENNAFDNCSVLNKIIIPESVTSIGNEAFRNCKSLNFIKIPNSVTSIGEDTFSGCISLPVVDNILYADCVAVGVVTNTLSQYKLKEDTRFIGTSAFKNCVNLISFTIPNSVTDIGDDAFAGCHNLNTITIPNSVTCIGKYAFYQCYNITHISIPNSVTSIGSWAFFDCTSITNIIVPNTVINIGRFAFSGCISLASATIGNSVTTIGNYAFEGCTSLTYITIPNSVTSIGNSTFSGCESLTNVNVSCKDVDDFCKYIERDDINSVFHTTGLNEKNHRIYIAGELQTSITIPNSVTSIGDNAFSNCSDLTSITIPNSVNRIGNYAFYGADKLNEIYSFAILPPTCGSSIFSEDTYIFSEDTYKTANVYVPNTNNALTRYLSAKVWKNFYNIQERDLTDIDTPNITTIHPERNFYNIHGQHTTTLSRGINIINGKKVFR